MATFRHHQRGSKSGMIDSSFFSLINRTDISVCFGNPIVVKGWDDEKNMLDAESTEAVLML